MATIPCSKCSHPAGTHNYSYGCQRKNCGCQEYTKFAENPDLRFNVSVNKERISVD